MPETISMAQRIQQVLLEQELAPVTAQLPPPDPKDEWVARQLAKQGRS